MRQYGLDPAHYYTSPGLSWDALLKKTGAELNLLTDYDQHLFIEKGMRGSISMVSKRHARANNPLVEGFNPSKPKSHNLYGWAMSQPLPTGGFKWVEEPLRLAEIIAEHPADSLEGYILEVDLEYPAELHDAHDHSERVDVRVSAQPSRRCPPSTPSAGSQKTVSPHWPTATKMPSPPRWGAVLALIVEILPE